MDMAPIVNGLNQFAVSSQTLVMLAIVLVSFAMFYVSTFGRKLRERVAETMFTNWRLGLLGATGLVLSLASGWTTWDGMRNFTQEPLLSLMITFGIQGVMLIVAWLIGESFASGMNYRPAARVAGPGGAAAQGPRFALQFLQPLAGTAIGILLFVAIAVLILNQAGLDESQKQGILRGDWGAFSDRLLFAAVAVLLVATLILNGGSDIADDYMQAIKVMIRSAVLWIMFLACMATSVFFSFDSLFSTIFPKQERERAAVLRAQNQVAGVVNDIGGLAVRRRIEEQDALFNRAGWKDYEQTLDTLVRVAREAPGQLEAYFERKMRDRQRLVAKRQEEKATAEGQQVRLTQRKSVIISEIGRLKEQVGPLAAETERFKAQVFEKDREIIAKKAEAEAEAGGIGATSKVGRGPKYREIANELRKLQAQKENLELQLREFERRLTTARNNISQNEAELASIDGQLAQLKGRAQTAEQLITMAQEARESNTPQFDPTNGLRQLERARIAFRQAPTNEGLERIQTLCTTLVGAMVDVPTLKDRARAIDCDPGRASEAAARVFALNVGISVLNRNCVGGSKLPQSGGADALFTFARSCVQDAGLPSADTDRLRMRINYLELNRDDKAHRFVVTSNAFQDGNKLAYLALAIAIAIDTLVFMSGLFGANAVRSPLSDVPTHKGRSAQQLEAVIDVALGPHAYETALHVLGALHPITPTEGFTAEVIIERGDPHAADIRRVLNAGASIGAVRHIEGAERTYQVRSELFEYLSMVAKREFEKDKSHGNLADLERTISVALLPHVGQNTEMVLGHLHPIREHNGFMAEIRLVEVEDHDIRAARSALNAGAVYERVQRVGDDPHHYYIHSDFYKTLIQIRGRLLVSGATAAAPAAIEYRQDAASPRHGGDLTQTPRQISEEPTRQITGPAAAIASHDPASSSPAKPPPLPERAAPAAQPDFGSEYWDRLVGAMGINPEVARLRLSNEDVVDASRHVWSALDEQAAMNAKLERFIREHEQVLKARIAEVYSTLRREVANAPERQGELDDADTDVENHFFALLMFPESGLVDHLIEGYEMAAAYDNGLRPEEQALKDGLVAINQELRRMNMDSATGWHGFAKAINDLPDANNVVPMPGQKDGGRRSAT